MKWRVLEIVSTTELKLVSAFEQTIKEMQGSGYQLHSWNFRYKYLIVAVFQEAT